MLKEIIQDEKAASILKILIKNQTAVIISYPSYEILAASDDILKIPNIIGKRHDEIDNPSAAIATALRQAKIEFRSRGFTSSWLIALKLNALSPASLFLINDVPIFHNKKLVGILITFRDLTLDNLLLIDKYFNSNKINKTNGKYNFSNSEKEILFLSALGKSSKQISNLLMDMGIKKISYGTVKSVISQRIYKKININNLNDAILKGIQDKKINNIPDTLLQLNSYFLIDSKHEYIEI